MNPPCYHCKSRTATCHSTCTAHALWKVEQEAQKERERQQKANDKAADGVLYKRKCVSKRIESKWKKKG